MNKRYLIMLILFFFVISLGIGLTYSFYTPTIIDNQVSSTTKISNKNIEANYINGSDILIDSTHTSITKNITIKNNNVSTVDYVLNFSDVINTLGDKTKLTYSYTCTGTGCSGRSNMEVPSIDGPLTLLVSIGTGITHTYAITFTYNGIPSGSFTSRIESVKPSVLIASTGYGDTRYFWGYKASITSVTFEKGIDIPVGAAASWDVSAAQDGSVMAYIIGSTTYDLYFQTESDFLLSNSNSSYLFYNFTNLTTINNISMLRTYYVTEMSEMFAGCSSLTSLDLSTFDTSSVTTMSNMFYNCNDLTSLDLSLLVTINVTNMSAMFDYCINLTSLNLNSFDTSNVTNMSSMFGSCTSLNSLVLGSIDTSLVTNMSYMFQGCTGLTSLNLSSFDTSNVTDMSWMFYNCTGLTSLNISSLVTSSVTNMSYMFLKCSSLASLDLSSFNTANVTNMYSMFSGCTGLTSLDLSNFNTSKVTSMTSMFGRLYMNDSYIDGCTNLTTLNISNFDTSNVISMDSMFSGCGKLTTLNLVSFDTSKVNNMNYMFYNCSLLTNLDLRNANFTLANSNYGMFSYITSGINIVVKDSTAQTWITDRLTQAGRTGNVTIYVP